MYIMGILSIEELHKLACKGFKNTFISHYQTNPNLFDLMFEWIDVNEFVKTLRFKQFRTEKDNYAPYFSYIGEKPIDYLYEKGKYTPIHLYTTFFGSISIKYPVDKCYVKILAPIYNDMFKSTIKQVEDFTNLIEINFSPETISKCEREKEEKRIEEQRSKEREEIEAVKAKLLKKKRREELEKMALRELMDEGILFPEAGKRPPIPKDVVDAVWRRDGGKCVYCGSTENLQLDHIIPFSKGGATTVENLQLLCQKCNLQKSNKIG